jgi:hypothetical protein
MLYARRRHAVTAGDATAQEALKALARVDLARLSTPAIFLSDLLDLAWKIEEEAERRGLVKPL